MHILCSGRGPLQVETKQFGIWNISGFFNVTMSVSFAALAASLILGTLSRNVGGGACNYCRSSLVEKTKIFLKIKKSENEWSVRCQWVGSCQRHFHLPLFTMTWTMPIHNRKRSSEATLEGTKYIDGGKFWSKSGSSSNDDLHVMDPRQGQWKIQKKKWHYNE